MPIFNSSGLGASAGRQRPKAPQRHGGSATQALGFGCKHQSFNQTCACTKSKKILAPLDVLVACAQPLDCFPKALRPCPSWLMRADQQMYIFAFQIAVQRPGQKASSSELPHVRVSLLSVFQWLNYVASAYFPTLIKPRSAYAAMALSALRKRSLLLLLPQPAVPCTLSSFRVRSHSTDGAGKAPNGPLKGVKVANASAFFHSGALSMPARSAAAAL